MICSKVRILPERQGTSTATLRSGNGRISKTECWCERGDSNPHGFTRQILSSSRTKNQQLARRVMKSDYVLQMPCPARTFGAILTVSSTW